MNQKLIILCGVSGSGKSTFAKEYIKENPNTVRVNRDDMRVQVLGDITQDYYSKANNNIRTKLEKHITIVQNEMIRYWLQHGFDVMADNTHLRKDDIQNYVDNFTYLADIYIKPFPIELGEAQFRVVDRAYPDLPPNTTYIERQIAEYNKIAPEFKDNPEGIFIPKKEIISIPYNEDLEDCIICDLDGTIASCEGIRSPYDGHLLHLDKPIEATRTLLKIIENEDTGDLGTQAQIIYVSGREDKWKNATINWIVSNGFPYHNRIHMRRTGDTRKDTVVKKEIYETYIKGYFNVIGAFEDRKSVKAMWGREGIFVYDVNQFDKVF